MMRHNRRLHHDTCRITCEKCKYSCTIFIDDVMLADLHAKCLAALCPGGERQSVKCRTPEARSYLFEND